jgi:C4-type Zn-finger protein
MVVQSGMTTGRSSNTVLEIEHICLQSKESITTRIEDGFGDSELGSEKISQFQTTPDDML